MNVRRFNEINQKRLKQAYYSLFEAAYEDAKENGISFGKTAHRMAFEKVQAVVDEAYKECWRAFP